MTTKLQTALGFGKNAHFKQQQHCEFFKNVFVQHPKLIFFILDS